MRSPKSKSKPKPTELALEIDGADSEPKQIDTSAALELAASYFGLIETLARVLERGDFRFRGLRLQNKCTLLAAIPSNLSTARDLAIEADRMIAGAVPAPRGASIQVDRTRRAVRETKKSHRSAKVLIDDWSSPLSLPDEKPESNPEAIVTLRVKVVETGGEVAKVEFDADSEPDHFRLTATIPQTKELARYLYDLVDLTARVRRSSQGRIVGGDVISFEPVGTDPDGGLDAFTKWAERAGAGWDEVDDPLKELGRGD